MALVMMFHDRFGRVLFAYRSYKCILLHIMAAETDHFSFEKLKKSGCKIQPTIIFCRAHFLKFVSSNSHVNSPGPKTRRCGSSSWRICKRPQRLTRNQPQQKHTICKAFGLQVGWDKHCGRISWKESYTCKIQLGIFPYMDSSRATQPVAGLESRCPCGIPNFVTRPPCDCKRSIMNQNCFAIGAHSNPRVTAKVP
jgi:hypothetical protein